MIATLLALNLVFSMSHLSESESKYFPGSYYNETMRQQLHNRVLTRWSGPNTLFEVWQTATHLNPRMRVTLLLGGAAFHNPLLLPAYIKEMSNSDTRARQAAAYGYRDLIGDRLPNVSSGITPNEAQALEGEMRAVMASLRANTLTEMWAAALLNNEGILLPEYRGVILKRRPIDCLNSLDVLVQPEDLKLLATTYRLSRRMGTRISLLKLIEGISLRKFLVLPQGSAAKWGPKDYEKGLSNLDRWLDHWEIALCGLHTESVLTISFREMGINNVNPLGAKSCPVWLGILNKGDPGWWGLASRRLYECGSPPARISILQPTSEDATKRRDSLLKWNGLRALN